MSDRGDLPGLGGCALLGSWPLAAGSEPRVRVRERDSGQPAEGGIQAEDEQDHHNDEREDGHRVEDQLPAGRDDDLPELRDHLADEQTDGQERVRGPGPLAIAADGRGRGVLAGIHVWTVRSPRGSRASGRGVPAGGAGETGIERASDIRRAHDGNPVTSPQRIRYSAYKT